jgi:hypothetical protein
MGPQGDRPEEHGDLLVENRFAIVPDWLAATPAGHRGPVPRPWLGVPQGPRPRPPREARPAGDPGDPSFREPGQRNRWAALQPAAS